MAREAIRVQQEGGSFKIVFRDPNTSKKPEKVEQKNEARNEVKTESKNKDSKQKSRDPEKMRYFNPLHPGHIDIFGRVLIGKNPYNHTGKRRINKMYYDRLWRL